MVRFATAVFVLVLAGCTKPVFLDDGGTDSGVEDASRDATLDSSPDAADAGADGSVDAGPFDLGLVHQPISLHVPSRALSTASSHYAPELTTDGTQLFFTRVDDRDPFSGELWTAARIYDTTDGSFGEFDAPEQVPLTPSEYRIQRATLTGDGLLVYVESLDPDDVIRIRSASRGLRMGTFGDLDPVDAFPTGAQHPSVSGDGLTLVAQVGGQLQITERSMRGTAFPAAVPVDTGDASEATEPRLSRDGLVLTYRDGVTHYEVTRASRDTSFAGRGSFSRFNEALGADGWLPFHHEGANELWYTREWPMNRQAPGLGAVLMRAHFCVGSCPSTVYTPCEGRSGSVESADGLHCFVQATPPGLGTASDWEERLEQRCAELEMFGASIHTPEEAAAAAMLFGGTGRSYIGLRLSGGVRRWASGERFFGGNWMAAPDASDVGAIFRATDQKWEPADGLEELAGICEVEIWPRWPATP